MAAPPSPPRPLGLVYRPPPGPAPSPHVTAPPRPRPQDHATPLRRAASLPDPSAGGDLFSSLSLPLPAAPRRGNPFEGEHPERGGEGPAGDPGEELRGGAGLLFSAEGSESPAAR